jgi:hypothetical protein
MVIIKFNNCPLLNSSICRSCQAKAGFGLKEHAYEDVKQGFVLTTEMTAASHHDSPYLPHFLITAGMSCFAKVTKANNGFQNTLEILDSGARVEIISIQSSYSSSLAM